MRTRRLLLLITAFAAGLLFSVQAFGAAGSSTLGTSEVLGPGQSLSSPDGHFTLTLRADGNLVETWSGGRSLWATGTQGQNAQAVMQPAGSLVVQAGGQTLWSSNSHTNGCPSLNLQNDGNLVISDPAGAAWANVAQPHDLRGGDVLRAGWTVYSPTETLDRLVMQSDGNLVLYHGGTALWSSGTGGHPGALAVLQSTDGNLVVYLGNSALWNSRTAGHASDHLAVQDDGNLVIYQGNTVLWASHTRNPGAAADRQPRAPLAHSAACATPPPATTSSTVTVTNTQTTTTTTTTTAPAPPPVTVELPPPPRNTGHDRARRLTLHMTLVWKTKHGITAITRAALRHLPPATRLTFTCTGPRCPRLLPATATNARSLSALLRTLRAARFHGGEVVYAIVVRPGFRTERVRFRIRTLRKVQVTRIS